MAVQSCTFLSKSSEIGGCSASVRVADEPIALKQLINNALPDFPEDSLVCHPAWIKHCNCTYKKFSFIVARLCVLPAFGKVVDLLVLQDGCVLLNIQIYDTVHFHEHYHAFVVKRTCSHELVKLTSLPYPFVLHSYRSFNKEDYAIYIVLKYGIDMYAH